MDDNCARGAEPDFMPAVAESPNRILEIPGKPQFGSGRRTFVSYVLFFNELDKESLPLAGGKAANLGEMTKAGFPVPQGFCVTTGAYREWIGASGRMEERFRRLEQVHPDSLEEIRGLGEEIRGHLETLPMPEPIRAEIAAGWRRMGEGKAYAVRSSATAEDLSAASFAGQLETCLNMSGLEPLLQAVRRCWASLFTDRAIAYRARNGFAHRDVLMAVVVQEMVFPEVSGIAFTADPVTGNRRTVSIDAGFGLGEALVAGLVSADLYQVRSGEITLKQISRKKLAIYSLPEGGTETRELPAEMQETQALPDSLILELAALARKIGEHYGTPQDIEWCRADGRFHVVQSRPITSLYPVPKVPDKGLQVLLSFGHQQMMTDALKPMGISFLRTLFPFGKPGGAASESVLLTPAASRLFINPTELLQIKLCRRFAMLALRNIDERIGSAMMEIAARPGFQRKPDPKVKRRALRLILPLLREVLFNVLVRDPGKAGERITAFAERMLEEAERLVNEASGAERIRTIQNFLGRLFLSLIRHAAQYPFTGILSFKMLERLCGRWLGDSGAVVPLGKSLPGNVTSEMGLWIGDLADAARPHPELIEYLRQAGDDLPEGMDAVMGGGSFREKWDRFMALYGMRCPGEIDVANPRWREAPALLVAPILGHIRSVSPGEHRLNFSRGAEEAARAAEDILSRLGHTRWGWFKRRLVARLIRVFRGTMGLREYPKYAIIRHFDLFKKVIAAEAGEMVRRGLLDREDDVFYLTLEEFALLLEERFRGEVRKEIEARRKQFVLDQKRTPPRVMTSEGEIVTGVPRRTEAPAGALVGTPVSAGTAEGYARIVLRPEESRLGPGEILVAPFTDPGWTPLFHSARGLITEAGGMMTHGAVVAREYGIPAVVGVDRATELLRDGDYVRLDGSRGIVEILRRAG
jgi:pyruvate,water dikinase